MLRLPSRVRTLVVFGGTFDPPHRAHVTGVRRALRSALGDAHALLYVPAARNPLKETGPLASDADRVAMLTRGLGRALRAEAGPVVRVWTGELDGAARSAARGGTRSPSYTIDTLRRLRRALPRRVALRLLIGADQAAAFHRWKDARAVVRLAEPLVLPRAGVATREALAGVMDAGFWTPRERAAWGARLLAMRPIDVSSTAVRDALRGAGRDVRAWRANAALRSLPAPVARHIAARGLYGVDG